MRYFLIMILLLILLLIFHTQVIAGTQNGLLLWYQTLIPSLLPFILVTNALSETNAYQAAAKQFHKYFPKRIYELMAIILGNMCGYPIGGKIVNDFVASQYISSKKANQLLSLSSQASPMFLIGFVYEHIIEKNIPLSVFLTSIYLPTIIAYPILIRKNSDSILPNSTSNGSISITDTFLHGVQTMVMIGMYVIIFSILLTIFLPICKTSISRITLSFFEITTGLKLIKSLYLPKLFYYPLICSLTSFGGLCSAFQIKGVLNYPNASIKQYLRDKILLSAGTFLIILFYLWFYTII